MKQKYDLLQQIHEDVINCQGYASLTALPARRLILLKGEVKPVYILQRKAKLAGLSQNQEPLSWCPRWPARLHQVKGQDRVPVHHPVPPATDGDHPEL